MFSKEVYFLIGLIIVAIILFVLYKNNDKSKYYIGKNLRRNLWDKYKRTNGTFDEHANDIMNTFDPEPEENNLQNNFAVAATLINNILRNEDYKKDENLPTYVNMTKHYTDHIVQDMINNNNLTNVPVNYIVNTIEDFQNDFINNNKQLPFGNIQNKLGFGFLETNLETNLETYDTTPVNNILYGPEDPRNMINNFTNENNFIDNLGYTEEDINLQRVLLKSSKSKKKRAQQDARNKLQAINNAINNTNVITSDPQNVHDSQLNRELHKQYNFIKSNNSNVRNININEIENYIKNKKLDHETRNAALKTLRKLKKNNQYITKLKENELNVLSEIWKRSEHPANEKMSDNIKSSIINNLADCVENGNVVCPTGRVSRIISSLALIDKDNNLGIIKTKDMYRKEIMDKCGHVINKTVEMHKNNNNDVAKAYLDPSIPIDEDRYNIFTDMLKEKVAQVVDEYKGIISNNEIKKIKNEMQSFIE